MYLDTSFGGEQPVSHAHEQAQELHLSMAMYMGMSSTANAKPLCFLRPTSGPGEYVLGLVELGGCEIALSLSHRSVELPELILVAVVHALVKGPAAGGLVAVC